jgi:hypothetical protein
MKKKEIESLISIEREKKLFDQRSRTIEEIINSERSINQGDFEKRIVNISKRESSKHYKSNLDNFLLQILQ